MTYLYEALPKPTRLYIKQCPHCGLKYFGKTIREDIENYTGSGLRWTRHLEKYCVKPIHLWNSEWFYDTSIQNIALDFSRKNNIIQSDEWANLTEENGLGGGDPGPIGRQKISETVNSEEWKKSKGKECREKQGNSLQKTMNDDQWKSSIGKERSRKIKETHNNEEWKATTKKSAIDKMVKTRLDPEWKSTVGIIRSEKASRKQKETLNNPEWKSTVGEHKRLRSSVVQNDPEWKARKYKTCEHCGKGPMHPSNYTRHHGDNCKHTSHT